MKHIFIMNPTAGNGIDCNSYMEKIKSAFKELDIQDEYEIHVTTSETDAYDYTKSQVETGEHIRFYAIYFSIYVAKIFLNIRIFLINLSLSMKKSIHLKLLRTSGLCVRLSYV